MTIDQKAIEIANKVVELKLVVTKQIPIKKNCSLVCELVEKDIDLVKILHLLNLDNEKIINTSLLKSVEPTMVVINLENKEVLAENKDGFKTSLTSKRIQKFINLSLELEHYDYVVTDYDGKKFIIDTCTKLGIIDYYPKSDKILRRKDNVWFEHGLKWIKDNIMYIAL